MADRKVVIKSQVDSSGAKAGFDRIKADGKLMADDVAKSGKAAGEGLAKGVGDGAKKVPQATKTMEASLKRSITRQTNSLKRQYAELVAGSKNTQTYFKTYAEQSGVAANKLEKQLADLVAMEEKLAIASRRAAEESQNRNLGSVNAYGAQKYQTANLAAQLQDIAVSSTMAMNPLQIALQQGTQISAIFGSQGASGSVGMLSAAFRSVISPMSLFTIGAVAAVAMLVQWAQKAFTAEESTKSLADTFQEFESSVNQINNLNISGRGIDTLTQKYGTLTAQIREALQEQVRLSIQIAKFDATQLVKKIREQFSASESEGGLGLFPSDAATFRAPRTTGASGYQNYLNAEYVTKLSSSTETLMKNFGLTEERAIGVQTAIKAAFDTANATDLTNGSLANLRDILNELTSTAGTDKQKRALTEFSAQINSTILDLAQLNQKEKQNNQARIGFKTATPSQPTVSVRNAFMERLQTLEREASLSERIRTQQAGISELSTNYARQLKEVEIRAQAISAFEQQVAEFKKQQVESAATLARQQAEQSGQYNETEIMARVNAAREQAAASVQFDPTRFGFPSDATIDEVGAQLSERFWQAWQKQNPNPTDGNPIVDALKKYVEKATNTGKAIGKAIESGLDSAADAIVEFVATGKANFSSLAASILKDFAKIAVQKAITAPIASSFTTFLEGMSATGNARGNAFLGGHLQAFAKGGVVTRPTLFRMANGAGLMGEKGAEAVMPLTRDAQGRLGVRAQTGGQNMSVHFELVNQSSQPLTSTTQQSFYNEDMKSWVVRAIVEDYSEGGDMRNLLGDK